MAAFNDVTVTVASLTAKSLKLTINSETVDLDPVWVRGLVQGRGHNIAMLIFQIALALFQAGVDMQDGQAIKAFIEGQTWKYGG